MKKHLRAIAAGILSLLLLVSLVGCGDEKGGDVFGFILATEPQQIDPQAAGDTASLTVVSAIFEGLTRVDEDGEVVAGAADWTVSDDGLTYTFKLKDSCWNTVTVRGEQTGFEDPVKVSAYDFEFGIRRTADASTASPHAAQLNGIVNADAVREGKKPSTALGVQAIDEDTLVIRLDKPDANFLYKLSTPAFMPCSREFFAYTGGRYGLEAKYILSNGAFSVSSWQHGQAVSLKKNPHYHAAAEVMPAAVKYRVAQAAEDDYTLLQNGYIDAAPVPADKVAAAAADGVVLHEMQDTVLFLWMNNQNHFLGNVHIRRAIRDAIEWETVGENLPADHTPALGFVAPAAQAANGAFYADNANVPFMCDGAAAKASLQKGLEELEETAVGQFTVLASKNTAYADLARYIIQSLSKHLGVRCTLETLDEATLQARVRAGNYQLAVCAAVGKGASVTENLGVFTTNAAIGNYARFSDAAFDALYQKSADELADAQKLHQHLLDNCPALPLGFYTRYYGVRAEVSGITVAPFDGGKYGKALSFREAIREE